MKYRKTICIICLFLLCLTVLFGCSKTFSYSFRKARSQIATVEICAYDRTADQWDVLVQLTQEQVNEILADIQALQCHKSFQLDPILSYGDVAIFFTYQNGEQEIIGIYNTGWITPEGKKATTSCYFEINDICAVIAKYVDRDVLASVSDYFK